MFSKHIAKNLATTFHQFVAEGHCRQQANDVALGAINQQASVEALLDDRCPWHAKFQANHQTANSQLGDVGKLIDQRSKLPAETFAQVGCPLQKSLFFDHLDRGDARSGGDGLPPNVAACMPGRRLLAISFRASIGSAGDSAAQALGQRHDIWLDAKMLIGEPLAGPTAAGLHLVEDEQQASLVGQFSQAV